MKRSLPWIDPTAGGGKAKIALAPRPMDLAGKVVGLLDNTKEQGDVILETIGEALRERHGVARVVHQAQGALLEAGAGALIDEIANEVEVAIAAVGG